MEEKGPRSGRKPFLSAIAIAISCGVAGLVSTYVADIDRSIAALVSPAKGEVVHSEPQPVFVELDPITVGIGDRISRSQVRLRATLELSGSASRVTDVLPRIESVIAAYLQSLTSGELADPRAYYAVQAQILYRARQVVGAGVIEQVLITEFVIA
jgi:flagellar basal body-associated protein FliL